MTAVDRAKEVCRLAELPTDGPIQHLIAAALKEAIAEQRAKDARLARDEKIEVIDPEDAENLADVAYNAACEDVAAAIERGFNLGN